MASQDPSIGVVTRQDLLEGLRVNRSLLEQARGDLSMFEHRVEACRERIRVQERLIEQWTILRDEAPEKIGRIESAIKRQEEQLARMGVEKAEEKLSKEKKIQMLVERISRGDVGAIGELKKLVG